MSVTSQPLTQSSAPAPTVRERRRQIVGGVGRVLEQLAPSGWRRLDLQVRFTVAAQDIRLTVVMADGTSLTTTVPQLTTALTELRLLMYQPGEGTWFAARFHLDPDAFRAAYDFDNDPRWDPPLPAEAFRTDVEMFPRDARFIPPWLHRKLAEAAAQ